MPFDYKKEYREFYLPPKKPHLITIPRMNFVAVHGKGDPNAPGGAYQEAMGVLYGIAFTIKMSYKGSHKMDGYFEYVVQPLEGLWHQKGVDGVDYAHKELFEWTAKKKKDFSKAEFLTYDEELCIQCLHIGPYDEEPKTLAQMDAFAVEQGYRLDFSETRFHHEIYLSDPRRAAPGTLKTVLRHPIREK